MIILDLHSLFYRQKVDQIMIKFRMKKVEII